jgi:hypothetical protein
MQQKQAQTNFELPRSHLLKHNTGASEKFEG